MSLWRASRVTRNFTEEPALLDEVYLSRLVPPKKFLLRKYLEGDREEVRRICCETGFLGQPIDVIYRDRELFADLITNPYLDYEPEWALIAESEGEVVGYLLSSINPHFNRNLLLSGFRTASKMLTRFLTKKYKDHPRSEQFVRWVWTKGMVERPNHPENASHLHLNLVRIGRVGLVAKRLLLAYEDMLRAAGVEHYYAEFFSCPQRHPHHIYTRWGFQVYDQSETTIFQPEYPNPLSIVCTYKMLTPKVVGANFYPFRAYTGTRV